MTEIIKEISEYVSRYRSIEKVLLFGSRARGDNRARSDFDIAVFGNVADDDCAQIACYFEEEINTLLKIDCIYIKNIEKRTAFYDNIIKEGVIIYERK